MKSLEYTTTQLGDSGTGEQSQPESIPLGDLIFGKHQLMHGVFPPIELLNQILDAGSIVDVNNLCYCWTPFSLAPHEYSTLREEVRANPHWGVEIDETFDGPLSEWGHWAFVKAMNKSRSRKRS